MAELTPKQIAEAVRLHKLCITGKAPNRKVKAELIQLYNEIHGTKYNTGSNCSSCLNTCFNGIKSIAKGNV